MYVVVLFKECKFIVLIEFWFWFKDWDYVVGVNSFGIGGFNVYVRNNG